MEEPITVDSLFSDWDGIALGLMSGFDSSNKIKAVSIQYHTFGNPFNNFIFFA